jgi:hypothetical protein
LPTPSSSSFSYFWCLALILFPQLPWIPSYSLLCPICPDKSQMVHSLQTHQLWCVREFPPKNNWAFV